MQEEQAQRSLHQRTIGILAALQITVMALIESHPNKDRLRSEMQRFGHLMDAGLVASEHASAETDAAFHHAYAAFLALLHK